MCFQPRLFYRRTVSHRTKRPDVSFPHDSYPARLEVTLQVFGVVSSYRSSLQFTAAAEREDTSPVLNPRA